MAANLHIFLVFIFFLLGCYVHDTQGDLPFKKWFNPLRWKDYWKSLNLRHTVRKPFGVKSDQPQLKGPNVCSVQVPIQEYRCYFRSCRYVTYYLMQDQCCPGFETVPGQRGCPKEKYSSKRNLVEVAKKLNLNTLVQLVTAAGLGGALIDPSAKLTVFAPSNEAFAKVPQSTLDALKRNPTALANLLKFHVAPGKVPAESLRDNQLIPTLNSPNKLRVNIGGQPKTVVIQGGRVTKANQGASNGIIHVVDSVLMPAEGSTLRYLQSKAKFSKFTELVQFTRPDLRNTTVFAPSDDAFNALPSGRLASLVRQPSCANALVLYHIIGKPVYSGVLTNCRVGTKQGSPVEVRINPNTKSVMINDATVTKADVSTTDGVVHEINKVLMPVAAMDIVEAAQTKGLTELVKLLESTGLAEALRNIKQPITLFAPTNAAFQALPDAVKKQLQNDSALLADILKYHVTPGQIFTFSFGKDRLVSTLLANAPLRLNTYRFGKVHSVDGTCIKVANVAACNSVIHVIPKVLTPPTQTLYEAISTDSRLTTLTTAIDRAGLRSVLENSNVSLTVFAPTNNAFSQFPQLQQALANRELLTRVLLYHVSNGTFSSCALDCRWSYWSLFSARKVIRSLNNDFLTLRLGYGSSYFVNRARVIQKDLLSTNGVLNIIDMVLQPGYHRYGRKYRRGDNDD